MLISGKEALIAWANGEQIELKPKIAKHWLTEIEDMPVSVFDSDFYEFRLKPRTISINGIEVPAPFKPKEDCTVWILDDSKTCGYRAYDYDLEGDCDAVWLGLWRTEEEIKQVVEALRSVFK